MSKAHFSSPMRNASREASLVSKLATVFPYFKIRRQDFGALVQDYNDMLSELSSLETAVKWRLLVDTVPRLVGLLHSISDTEIHLVEFFVDDNTGDVTFDVLFPRLVMFGRFDSVNPFKPLEVNNDVQSYLDWAVEQDTQSGKIRDEAIHDLFGRIMAFATMRYKKFPSKSWSDYLAEFWTKQIDYAYNDLCAFIAVREQDEVLDFPRYLALVDRHFQPVSDYLNWLYRSLLMLEPKTLRSWVARDLPKPAIAESESPSPDGDDGAVVVQHPATSALKSVPKTKKTRKV